MSELSVEEKEAINNLRFYSTNVGFSKYDGTACLLRARDVQILLNLIGNQQKELYNLKEIEKSHREVNEKLRVELEQEKEINKEIAIKNHKIKEESNAYREEIIRLDNELEQEKEKNNNLIKQLQEQNTEIENIAEQLRQEKEKNKELQKYKEYYQEMEEVNKKFIAEGKIQAKIFELENSDSLEDSIAIPYLKKLLEEEI